MTCVSPYYDTRLSFRVMLRNILRDLPRVLHSGQVSSAADTDTNDPPPPPSPSLPPPNPPLPPVPGFAELVAQGRAVSCTAALGRP